LTSACALAQANAQHCPRLVAHLGSHEIGGRLAVVVLVHIFAGQQLVFQRVQAGRRRANATHRQHQFRQAPPGQESLVQLRRRLLGSPELAELTRDQNRVHGLGDLDERHDAVQQDERQPVLGRYAA